MILLVTRPNICTAALARLNTLRNAAQAETQSGNFVDSCFEVWKVLSDLAETSMFYLPPRI
jgi:hypothetical protein